MDIREDRQLDRMDEEEKLGESMLNYGNLGHIRIIPSDYMTKTITKRLLKYTVTHDGKEVVKTYRLPSITVPSDEIIYDNTRNYIVCHPDMVNELRDKLK